MKNTIRELGINYDRREATDVRLLKRKARNALKNIWRHEMKNNPTPAEKRMGTLLKTLGARFKPQEIVRGFIPDFWCADFRIVVEVDGSIHDTQQAYDRNRDEIFSENGIRVVRVTNSDVFSDPQGCLEKVKIAMREKAKRFNAKKRVLILKYSTGFAAQVVSRSPPYA